MWIKDHVDAYDVAPCPKCGQEAELGAFVNPCPHCGNQLSEDEWYALIEKTSLTQVEDWESFPESIRVSDEEAARILSGK